MNFNFLVKKLFPVYYKNKKLVWHEVMEKYVFIFNNKYNIKIVMKKKQEVHLLWLYSILFRGIYNSYIIPIVLLMLKPKTAILIYYFISVIYDILYECESKIYIL